MGLNPHSLRERFAALSARKNIALFSGGLLLITSNKRYNQIRIHTLCGKALQPSLLEVIYFLRGENN
jgi:hypothetical protein